MSEMLAEIDAGHQHDADQWLFDGEDPTA